MTSDPNDVQRETSYDEIPYNSQAYPQTHPDRLATLACLFGLRPATVTSCRVLELGCAGGGNLIPMAFHLPDSEFVGIDLSGRQIQQASETIAAIGLHNIRVENISIMDIDSAWGTFDYIICHGVYSWVSDEVREKILAVCSQNLAPQGVAYVSYNTYPGWHLREMIRHMMRYHIGQFDTTAKRIEQARALIDFLAESVSTGSYYGQMLRSELDLVKRVHDWYLFHDHLEEVNAPLYFHQFIAHAADHCLQYLGETDFGVMLGSGFPGNVAETLNRISQNIIRTEQYMDFLRNRFFRQTLLCHQNLTLNRNLNSQTLDGLLIASSACPETDPADLSPGQKLSFRMPSGETFYTDFPLTKAALCVLSEHWPEALDFDRLQQEAYERIGSNSQVDRRVEDWKTVKEDLLHCYTQNHVELHTWQAPFRVNVSEHPNVSRLAAYQINQSKTVVNQRHEQVALDAIGRELLRVLDGEQHYRAILDHLKQCVKTGGLVIHRDDEPLTDQALIEQTLSQALDQTLKKLARAALLVG